MRSNNIVAEFTDKYGDTRHIRQTGRRMQVAKNTDTVSHKMNRIAAVMIGQRVKERRLAAGMQLAELCERAGLVSATPKSRMWEIENAIRQEGLRMGTLFAIARALGCEATELMPTVDEVADMAGVRLTTSVVKRLSTPPSTKA